jgi:hypothetical protein
LSAPIVVVFLEGTVCFAYQIYITGLPAAENLAVEPITITRIDASWALTRDHNADVLQIRKARRVFVIGCGSLGSPVVELLARGGIGAIDILDAEFLETPNVGRHVLGMTSIGQSKAVALATRLEAEVPGLVVRSYQGSLAEWFRKRRQDEEYDLVVDCTGESEVRTLMSRERSSAFPDVPIVHAWIEPFCAAAHVALTQPTEPWPPEDPVDHIVNAADYPATGGKVELPACNAGFHPYGAADVWQAAGFTAERVLCIVDELQLPSQVWSWVRAQAFFDELTPRPVTRSVVPQEGTRFDAKMITRTFGALGIAR